jgi:hypothetical protein
VEDLPPTLGSHLDGDGRTLIISSSDVTAALRELVGWADSHRLDLSTLEVGPPSLEDAYLTAIGEPLTPERFTPTAEPLTSTHEVTP